MQSIFKTGVIALAVFLFSWKADQPSGNQAAYDKLKLGFETPPMQARPKAYWWWLNGNVDTAKLMEELKAMKDAGVAGVDIFDIGARAPNNPNRMIPPGPAFMGPESLAAIVKVIRKATEYQMEVSLNLASSWNAGGSWIKPEHAGKSLYHTIVNVDGPGDRVISVPFPKISEKDEKGKARVIVYDAAGMPVYHREVVVLAVPANEPNRLTDTSRIINVSRFFNAGKNELNWTVPAGKWEIQRYVCSNSGEQLKYYSDNSAGPIIDHFDSSATRAHLMHFINLLQPFLGDFRKTALKNFYLASFEATGSVWTESLPATFRQINGYDVYKMMPALISKQVFDSGLVKRFRHDFDLVISELMIRNHYGKAREISNQYGLQLISESGGPGPPLHNVPVEAIKALGALDIPRGEFWNKHAVYDQDSIDLLMLVKEVSAAAHMYHRKIAEEESFTSFQHWTEGPSDLRPLGDRAFCEGMNRVVVHGFSHNPSNYGFPGIYYHAGTHFNNKNLWWSKARPFTDYLARISYLMQETQFVSDVLYYYGDNVPNFVTPKNTRFSVPPGYDYDIINSDVLLRELTVKDGRFILPGGSSFRVLALGNMEMANAKVIDKLKKLAAEGGIITGQKPKMATGLLNQPQADLELLKTAAELWVRTGDFSGNTGGKILDGVPTGAILKWMKLQSDIDYADSQKGTLDFIHQRQDGLDLYFIRNTTDQPFSTIVRFRQQGKTPEIWDPVTGKIVAVNIFDDSQGQTGIPVSLAPYQSYFVLFKSQPGAKHYTSITATDNRIPAVTFTSAGFEVPANGTYELSSVSGSKQIESKTSLQTIDGTWTIHFKKGWGAPDSVIMTGLASWTSSALNGVKYYSGPAVYEKSFNYDGVEKDAFTKTYLDLGDLSKIAEVWLNGRSLGIAWTRPYTFPVSGLLKKGKNKLKIEVVNTWSNRLAGDAITGEKFTSTNLGSGSQGVSWDKSPLIPSGLFGPVTISQRRTFN